MLVQTFKERATATKKYNSIPEDTKKRIIDISFDDTEKNINIELSRQEVKLIEMFRAVEPMSQLMILNTASFEYRQSQAAKNK